MINETNSIAIPDEVVLHKIYLVRNVKVMLDLGPCVSFWS
jgi:hypothetical protein